MSSSLTDDTICSSSHFLEKSDMPLLSNDDFFSGKPSFPQPSSSSPSSSSFDQSSRPSTKRKSRTLVCRWCLRSTFDLYFNAGCTFECTLSYFAKNYPRLYNLVFIELCKHKQLEAENAQPSCIPQRNPDQPIIDYWKTTITAVYPDRNDVRRIVLLQTLIKRDDDFSKNFREETPKRFARQRSIHTPS
jgi:hypothetical protein